MPAVNVSAPETVDAKMTKSILEDHGVGAAASLVSLQGKTDLVGVPARPIKSLYTAILCSKKILSLTMP